jgi:hypothetical protein
MRRFPLIFVIMFMAAFAVAQTTPSAPATTPTIPTDGTVVTPTSPTGPTTPIINLGTTSPSPVGATSATPGNQAGATNSTLQQTAPSGVAPQSTYTTPMVENMPNWTGVAPAASANNQTTTPRDLVIGSSDSAWSISGGGVSVAAAARQYRAERAGRKPRMFTNADIARLRDRGAVSVVGNTQPPVTNEQTMPASDVETESGPTTPTAPQQQMQAPEQTVPAGQPKSPFNTKPSPQVQPQPR